MSVLGTYKNGNYRVILMDDGTKIRYNELDNFSPVKPESMDITISNYCEMGCEFCYAGCSKNGKHANIMAHSFIDNLEPYTELALNGNEPLHPDLIPFLYKCKELKLIPSLTVNQYTFMKNIELLKRLSDDKLIYGLGVSLREVNQKFINAIKNFSNAVIHVIAGIIEEDELRLLANNNLKILILGYKTVGRGVDFFETNEKGVVDHINKLRDKLPSIVENNWFKVVSFDNLAIEQLNVRSLLSDKEWSEFYMGDDGTMSMYVDMVKKKFSKNSMSTECYNLSFDIKTMFNKVRH